MFPTTAAHPQVWNNVWIFFFSFSWQIQKIPLWHGIKEGKRKRVTLTKWEKNNVIRQNKRKCLLCIMIKFINCGKARSNSKKPSKIAGRYKSKIHFHSPVRHQRIYAFKEHNDHCARTFLIITTRLIVWKCGDREEVTTKFMCVCIII